MFLCIILSMSTFHWPRKLYWAVFTKLVSHQKNCVISSTVAFGQIRLFAFFGGCVCPNIDLPVKSIYSKLRNKN